MAFGMSFVLIDKSPPNPFLLAFLPDVSFLLFFVACFVLVKIVLVAHHE